MRPRKLYHQRIIVITQRGIPRQRKQRAMPVVVACRRRCGGGEGGTGRGGGREAENLAIRAVYGCVIIPRVVNVIVRARTNCEPCETVNRGVTRFGGSIYIYVYNIYFMRDRISIPRFHPRDRKSPTGRSAPRGTSYRVIGPGFRRGCARFASAARSS